MAWESGKVYWICPVNNRNVALSVRGDSQVSQNRDVFLYTKEDIADQLWKIVLYEDEGCARILTTLNENYGLNIYHSTKNCDIYTVNGNEQDSKINFRTVDGPNNIYRIQSYYGNNENNNDYLTASAAASGASVTWQGLNESNNNQLWVLIEKTDEGSGGETGTSEVTWPLPSQYGITSDFRSTSRPDHDGVDLQAPANTPIYAIADGVVAKVATPSTNPSEGYTVRVNHVFSSAAPHQYVRSYYMHMVSYPPVSLGQTVAKGDIIGYVGSTGDSTGNHLHLGTRYSNSAFTVGGNFYEGVDFFDPKTLIGSSPY